MRHFWALLIYTSIALLVHVVDVIPPFASRRSWLVVFIINAKLSEVFKNDVSSEHGLVVWIVGTIFAVSEAVSLNKWTVTIVALPESEMGCH